MSYDIGTFTNKILLAVKSDKWYKGDRAAELNAIAAALNTDTTRRDATLQKPPTGLRPGRRTNTKFANNVLLVINRGKAGHLTPLAMSNAITAELSKVLPPVQTSPPVISGTATVGSTLTTTHGNWTYVPTSYTYQWRRGAVNISGATAATHVLVAADSGTNITMQLTAHNAAGSTPASLSNAIAVA
jgi:hypothetical protein